MKCTKLTHSLLLATLGLLFVGCSAKTIGDDGGITIPLLFNSDAQISILSPSTPLADLNVRSIDTFTEVYEEARGTMQLVGSRTVAGSTITENIEGTFSLYSGKTNDGTTGSGVFIQGDVLIALNSPRVKVYASEVLSTSLVLSDLTNDNLTGELLKTSHPTIGLQLQDRSLTGIKTIALVCEDESQNEEICGIAALEERDGLIGNSSWEGSRGHSASGSFRVYRDPQTFDIVTETAANYSGDAGPDLYWYFSEVPFTVGATDGRYSNESTSIITSKRRTSAEQSGMHSFSVQGTAILDLKDYKTVSVWCDKFSVLFQYAELIKL
jgi:hypothetical protein